MPRPASEGGEARPQTFGGAPIVGGVGHVDHGKTTLLDYLRKTSIALKEAGGITQSIGAYVIKHAAKEITFIDTPGHEAFSKMRARGAKAADLAILVVAADDGVKPQTKEVIQILKETQTPFIVAITKIDKNNANPEKVKQDLLQAEVLLEGFGGTVSFQGISSKTGEGIPELLDLILLTAELAGVMYNPEAPARGIIIESKMDSRRGLTAMGIVEDGILKIGDPIRTNSASGKVKILENFLGERVEELAPSSPVLILGFERLPEIGEEFTAADAESLIDTNIDTNHTNVISGISAEISGNLREGNAPVLVKVFLKADVSGSLEAISQILQAMPDVKIVQEGIGDISDGDVKNAQGAGAVIIGFKARVTKAAENLARANEVTIMSSDIIYELLKDLEEKIAMLRTPGPKGMLQILKTFSQKGRKQVVGGKMESGNIRVHAQVTIIRGDSELGHGRITNLQKNKKDATQVNEGEECGVMIESEVTIAVGDSLLMF